ncbi:hypothetical protein GCM10011504_07260 [Siccirubricoccus deserti]|nr:hypothetical protein GCM10011504_07260 [Siccirubricoccus deserti]
MWGLWYEPAWTEPVLITRQSGAEAHVSRAVQMRERRGLAVIVTQMPEPLMRRDQPPQILPAPAEVGLHSHGFLADAQQLGGKVKLAVVTSTMHRGQDRILQPAAAAYGRGGSGP